MSAVVRTKKFERTVTEVAILQHDVKMLNEKVDDIKIGIKDLHDCLDSKMEANKVLLDEFKKESTAQHDKLSEKVESFEKVKYMLMGAAALLAIDGWEAGWEIVQKLFF